MITMQYFFNSLVACNINRLWSFIILDKDTGIKIKKLVYNVLSKHKSQHESENDYSQKWKNYTYRILHKRRFQSNWNDGDVYYKFDNATSQAIKSMVDRYLQIFMTVEIGGKLNYDSKTDLPLCWWMQLCAMVYLHRNSLYLDQIRDREDTRQFSNVQNNKQGVMRSSRDCFLSVLRNLTFKLAAGLNNVTIYYL